MTGKIIIIDLNLSIVGFAFVFCFFSEPPDFGEGRGVFYKLGITVKFPTEFCRGTQTLGFFLKLRRADIFSFRQKWQRFRRWLPQVEVKGACGKKGRRCPDDFAGAGHLVFAYIMHLAHNCQQIEHAKPHDGDGAVLTAEQIGGKPHHHGKNRAAENAHNHQA